jgi:hypothetical protein
MDYLHLLTGILLVLSVGGAVIYFARRSGRARRGERRGAAPVHRGVRDVGHPRARAGDGRVPDVSSGSPVHAQRQGRSSSARLAGAGGALVGAAAAAAGGSEDQPNDSVTDSGGDSSGGDGSGGDGDGGGD